MGQSNRLPTRSLDGATSLEAGVWVEFFVDEVIHLLDDLELLADEGLFPASAIERRRERIEWLLKQPR